MFNLSTKQMKQLREKFNLSPIIWYIRNSSPSPTRLLFWIDLYESRATPSSAQAKITLPVGKAYRDVSVLRMQSRRGWNGSGLGSGWGRGGSGWSWAFAVHPVGGTSTTMEIKNAGGKEPGYKSGTTASSRIPGYSRAWKTMPPSRQCALHTASMNFHENYVRIFIPFSSRPSSPAATRFCLLSALPWSRCLLVSGNFRRPSRASFRICLICSFFSFFWYGFFLLYSVRIREIHISRNDAITLRFLHLARIWIILFVRRDALDSLSRKVTFRECFLLYIGVSYWRDLLQMILPLERIFFI